MKKYVGKLVALALFAVAVTGAALAQDSEHPVRAAIPFSFYAGGHLMPAGEYTVSVSAINRMVTIRQKETGSGAFLLGSAEDSSRDGRVVLTFKLVDGEAYALSDLRSPDLGLNFHSKSSGNTMRAQNQESQSVTVIAEAR